MSIVSSMTEQDRQALNLATRREIFRSETPLDQLLVLHKDPKKYFELLGTGWYDFEGLERLCTIETSPHALYPLNGLETLIHGMPHLQEATYSILQHFPNLRPGNLGNALAVGGFHHDAEFSTWSEKDRLTMYQWSAWNKSLAKRPNDDIGADIKVWNNAPAFVRMDPLMQQIVALKKPVLLQECIRREPHGPWDPKAMAISLRQTGIPAHQPWYRFMGDETFAMLMRSSVTTNEHSVLHKTNVHLYNFPENKLATLLDINPALFIHGTVCSRLLRESQTARAWFVPMLEASFKKAFEDPHYEDTLLRVRTMGPEQVKLFDDVLSKFAPQYVLLLNVHQSLGNSHMAYKHWVRGCANAMMQTQEHLPLPNLEDMSP